jgi:hypothetical protein
VDVSVFQLKKIKFYHINVIQDRTRKIMKNEEKKIFINNYYDIFLFHQISTKIFEEF